MWKLCHRSTRRLTSTCQRSPRTPRLKPLTIRNTPDNYGPYSAIYGGEQLTGVLFQLSRIADSMRKKQPAGFTRPHIDSAAGWGDALRNSGACT